MIDKMDKSLKPSKDDLISIVKNENCALLKAFCTFIETEIKAKEQIDYSICSGAPGWNLKYKKTGKSVCTIYPEKEKFIVLITLNFETAEAFNIVASSFSRYVRDLVKNVKPFNGAKWLMINVDNQAAYEDAKKLITLKLDMTISAANLEKHS